MFPADWDKATPEDKTRFARELLNSPRGQLLVGQALRLTSEWMKSQDHPFRELSNAEDMECMMAASDMIAIGWAQMTETLKKRGGSLV